MGRRQGEKVNWENCFWNKKKRQEKCLGSNFCSIFPCCLYKFLDFPSQQILLFSSFIFSSLPLFFNSFIPKVTCSQKPQFSSYIFHGISVGLKCNYTQLLSHPPFLSYFFLILKSERRNTSSSVNFNFLFLNKRYGREGEDQWRCQGRKVVADIFGNAWRLIK